MSDKVTLFDAMKPLFRSLSGFGDVRKPVGIYTYELRDHRGNVINRKRFKNLLVTVGMNEILNDSLRGSSYTVTGPYCGLISSVSWSAVALGDTMASHAGWKEAGVTNAPTYGATRPTSSFAAASGGAISFTSAASFTFTGSGTVQGAFVVTGSAATNAVDGTVGTLLSAGAFGTAQPVISGNVMTVNYTLTL